MYTFLRLAGLLGFLSLSCAVIINLYKPEMKQIFGRPFLPVHHFFALSGLILITLHPILVVLLSSNLTIFLPDFSSFVAFFSNGGRIAIILIYLVCIAGLLRLSFQNKWKFVHRLIYPALVIAIVHANLMGATFQNPLIWLLYNGLAGAVLVTGIIKVLRRREKRRITSSA
ncbi:MAG TPA: hypothetical protein VN372_00150 [Methanospirillum sp.]|nr:hypothetical protein [Methanospirillum sp.]